eukprot:scaffold243383_cov27-Tisochrysis_lutea.AAC.7
MPQSRVKEHWTGSYVEERCKATEGPAVASRAGQASPASRETMNQQEAKRGFAVAKRGRKGTAA